MNQRRIEKEARRVEEGGEADRTSQRPGDNRTPDKKIGQVKYADDEGGGAQEDRHVSARTTTLADHRARKSQLEGPAAYAPHREDEDVRANPGSDPAKKKTGEF